MRQRRSHRWLAVVAAAGCLLATASCSAGAEATKQNVPASSPAVSSVAGTDASTSVAETSATDVQAPATNAVEAAPPTAAPATPDSTVRVASEPPVPAATAGGKVNINTASPSELEAAFTAAGVTNARRWAREVDEYRPYSNDADFGQLRQELGKYNIAPDMLELIITTLEY